MPNYLRSLRHSRAQYWIPRSNYRNCYTFPLPLTHVDPPLVAVAPNDRHFPIGSEPLGIIGIVLDACLVAPVNFRLFLLGARPDLRVNRLVPLGDGLKVLLIGPLGRSQQVEASPFQIVGDGPQRHVEPVHLLNRQPHGIAGPNGKGQLELVRCLVCHQQVLGGGLLFGGQFALVTVATTVFSRLDGI